MRSKFVIFVLFLFVLVLNLNAQKSYSPTNSKRIAVLPFQTATGINGWWGGGFDPGMAITDLLTRELSHSKKFVLIDRKSLDLVIREQRLSLAGKVTIETAAKIGRLAGAQYIITGTITEFAQVKSGGKEFSLPIRGGNVKLGNVKNKIRTSVISTIIDVNTGVISQSVGSIDETSVRDFKLNGSYQGYDLGFDQKEFHNSGVGKSLSKIAKNLSNEIQTVPFKDFETLSILEGYVMAIDGTHVFLNIGEKAGVQNGMVFEISRQFDLSDPVTGEKKAASKPVGQIKIVGVEEQTSAGVVQDENPKINCQFLNLSMPFAFSRKC
ncbi:hypothetical protein HYY75_06955 [bacterium]|nr:hypothetical protein [bacterium]